MKSFDYYACTYDGAVYCTECLPDSVTDESEEVSPIFADSEWDSYPVCDKCGCVHDYVCLTSYGQAHADLKQAIEEHERGEFDGLVVADLSEVPEDYDGAVLHVNERGNFALYRFRLGKATEIASCV